MLTEQPTEALLAQFFRALPDAAIYLEAIRDEQDQLNDLVVAYGNEKGLELVAQGVFQANLGEPLLGDDLARRNRLQPVFRQYAALLLTGETQEFDCLDPVLHRVVHVTRSRLGNGILVVVRDPGAMTVKPPTALGLTDLLSGILEASLNGIITYESLRDGAGQITDFRFVRLNNAARQLLALSNEAVGKSLLDQLPGVQEAGLFGRFAEVVETGKSTRFETSFSVGSERLWYDMSVVKLGDGFVVTFNDMTESKRAAAEIERQKRLLHGVFNDAQIGLLLLEPVRNAAGQVTDFRIRAGNPAVRTLTGVDPKRAVGQLMSQAYPNYQADGFFAVYRRVIETGEAQRVEIYYKDDQLEGWFDVSAVRQQLGGAGDGIVLTFTNTTETRRAQQALERAAQENKQQADLLDRVLNSSNSGIMSLEAVRDDAGTVVDFRYLTGNQAVGNILGYPVETLLGGRLLTFFPNIKASGLFDLYVRTTETGEPGRTVLYYPYDGVETWFDVSTQKLGDGFVITFTDVSEQKRAAQTIEQAAQHLQTVIDTSQTGIFLFSPVRSHSDGPEAGEVVDFRFRMANRQLASYVGQPPETIIGALGSTWFPGYQTNGLFDAYYKTYVTGEPQRFDFHYNSDGIDVWLDILSTKMGDEVLVTFGDYTSLKQLQQQLEALVLDLQRSNRNLEQFAYVASHDLQEPLRKIQAFGDLLQNQYAPALGADGADIVRRMQSAANRMQMLIKDVLAYSRIATRREATRPVDLNQLVNGVLGDLETAIHEKQAVVRIGPLPTLNGDAPQLRQLFQNLIGNALKFAKPDERQCVDVTARTVVGRDADLPVSPSDASRLFHLIEVADNGIGFEPQYAERIFQVFQRLHSRSNYDGTGIGLAIVQKVVENHQGYIQAQSQPGQGATFRILLPA